MGLVSSLNRPGGNATGVTFFSALVGAKRLGLLRELVPTANGFALLLNPTNPNAEIVSKDLQTAAQTLGLQIRVLNARTEHEIDSAFATLAQQPVGALIVGPDAFFDSRANQIVTLAARHAIPAIYERREVVAADGLMSYGASPTEAYHQAGVYTGRILKGEKPADLPVIQSAKFELVINLRTAKALGIALPSGLLSIVDEVIE
jgi:putative ABC transport system substrate-binding protein